MKRRPLCALALFSAFLLPASVSAQAPAGVARVDSDTYFDTSNASWSYHNHQNNFTEHPVEQTTYQNDSSWSDNVLSGLQSSNGGLLGKTYIRGGMLYQKVDDELLASVDDSLFGWDVEFNTPIPWFTFDEFGVDFFAMHEQDRTSGSNAFSGVSISVDQNVTTIGGRFFGYAKSKFRPFAAVGVTIVDYDLSASGPGGSVQVSEIDTALAVNLGLEVDLAANAALRADLELGIGINTVEPKMRGLLIVWPQENFFIQGGILVPLHDADLGVGATVGGGLAFR